MPMAAMSPASDEETSVTQTTNSYRLEDLPMADDPAAAWDLFRSWGEVFQDEHGTWYITTARACSAAARKPKIFSSARSYDWQGGEAPLLPAAVDPPEHARYRRLLDPMVKPAVINELEPELRRQVAELIDAFVDSGSCNIVADLGALYPTQVFLTLYGLPLSDRDELIALVRTILDVPHIATVQTPQYEAAKTALFKYVRGFIEEKRRKPGSDMISRLLELDDEDGLTNEELVGVTYLMINAGLDTVRNQISLAFYRLAQEPQLRRRIVAEPESVPNIIEELMRIDTVAPFLPRITTEEVEIFGHRIPANAKVELAYGSSNHDPAKYSHPHSVDTDQAGIGHSSFGEGVHRCLGIHLARRELRLVLEEFHKRIPDYELAPGSNPRIGWPRLAYRFDEVPLVFPRPTS